MVREYWALAAPLKIMVPVADRGAGAATTAVMIAASPKMFVYCMVKTMKLTLLPVRILA